MYIYIYIHYTYEITCRHGLMVQPQAPHLPPSDGIPLPSRGHRGSTAHGATKSVPTLPVMTRLLWPPDPRCVAGPPFRSLGLRGLTLPKDVAIEFLPMFEWFMKFQWIGLVRKILTGNHEFSP